MRLFPFHAASTGLPELERGTWRDLMMCSSGRSSAASTGADDGGVGRGPGARPRQRTAGILLAEPHFIAVRGLAMLGAGNMRSLPEICPEGEGCWPCEGLQPTLHFAAPYMYSGPAHAPLH